MKKFISIFILIFILFNSFTIQAHNLEQSVNSEERSKKMLKEINFDIHMKHLNSLESSLK